MNSFLLWFYHRMFWYVVDSQMSSSLRESSFDPVGEEVYNILNRLLDPVEDIDDLARSIINGNDAKKGDYPWYGTYMHWKK
jgi:hypothetical protein